MYIFLKDLALKLEFIVFSGFEWKIRGDGDGGDKKELLGGVGGGGDGGVGGEEDWRRTEEEVVMLEK